MDEKAVSILVVDDEPPLLKLMQMYLERLGYSVTSCPDATSALETFQREPERFRLLIADLSLPGLSGDQMALRMVEVNHQLHVLLCSGYIFDIGSLPVQYRSRFAVLQKPFLPNMLAKSVEELLTSARS